MKKNNMTKTLLLLVMALGMNASALMAQVKIGDNPNTINESSILELESTDKGFLPPRMTTEQRQNIQNPAEGLVVYNTTKKCFEAYYGLKGGIPIWNCLSNNASGGGVTVTPIGFEGAYLPNVPLTYANLVKFRLKNNSLSPLSGVDFTNDVVYLSAPTGSNSFISLNNNYLNLSLAVGDSIDLVYDLRGNLASNGGIITVYFNKYGLQAEQSTVIGLGSAAIADKTAYILSYSYGNGGTTTGSVIDNNANKLIIEIPYSGGEGSYTAISQTQTAAAGEGGDENDLTLNIPAGTFNQNGNITATITVEGDGEYVIRQLDSATEYTVATFALEMNGVAYNVSIKAVKGVFDREFGDGVHDFIYMPIVAEDGRVWLSNNLGADYANVNHPSFNPTKQAVVYNDHRAYGSLYQWGRYSDGHEIIAWVDAASSDGTEQNRTTTTLSTTDTPGHDKYISATGGDWLVTANDSLWQGAMSINNPCPVGYRVPTVAELTNYIAVTGAAHIYDVGEKYSLHLTAAGYRLYCNDGKMSHVGYRGYYSTSTLVDLVADPSYTNKVVRGLGISTLGVHTPEHFKSFGKPVRCIKD